MDNKIQYLKKCFVIIIEITIVRTNIKITDFNRPFLKIYLLTGFLINIWFCQLTLELTLKHLN